MRFTDGQMDAAMNVPIKDILDLWGEKYHRAGTEYIWDKHDSIKFKENRWYRFSRLTGGGPISFVEEFDGRDFQSSVMYLLEKFRSDMLQNQSKRAQIETKRIQEDSTCENKKDIKKQVVLPKHSFSNYMVNEYLINERCVDPAIVHFFIKSGSLYASKFEGNAVFIGKDRKGFPRHCHIHGMTNETKDLRKTQYGSDSHYGFGHFGGGSKLYVFEAPIDLMSFVSIYQRDWQEQNYISLCGLSKNAIIQSLNDYPNIKTVVLCLDNDEAGNEAAKKISEYLDKNYCVRVTRLLSENKDWNEDLQNITGKSKEESEQTKNDETEEEEWGQLQY